MMNMKKIALNSNNEELGSFLIYSLILIPFFKLLTSAFSIMLPLYYVPPGALVCMMIFKQKFDKKALLFANSLLFFYVLPIFFRGHSVTLPEVKIFTAAFLFLNCILVLLYHFTENQNQWLAKKNKFEHLAIYSGFLFMIICLSSFSWNQLRFPLNLSFSQIQDVFSFSRSDPETRLEILLRFNPVGAIVNDIQNTRYIGQQLLILPLLGLIFLLNKITKEIGSVAFLGSYSLIFLICIFLTNSRGFALSLVALIMLSFARHINSFLHKMICLFLFTFPLLLLTLSPRFLSGRSCQISFVQGHLTLFGNGVGAFIDDLNSKCQPIITGNHYINIITTSYDNVHLEFIHYFGVLIYIPLIIYLLVFALRNNHYKTRILFFILFVFLSLNFNLFEFSILPCILCLYFDINSSRLKPGIDHLTA